MQYALLAAASLLAVTGVIGSLVPVLPGAPLGFAALLILHFARGGDVFGTGVLAVFGVLTLLSLASDYVLPLLGAKRHGASRYGIAGAVVGMIVGTILFSFVGLILGMLVGAVAGEMASGKRGGAALKSGAASLAGSLAAVLLKFGLSVVMAVLFFFRLIAG